MGEWSAPWSVKVGRNGAFSVFNSDDYPVCRIVHWTPPADEKEARLIAAAPDLFSIVARLVAMPGGAWNPDRHAAEEAELMADARAALAKASDGGA